MNTENNLNITNDNPSIEEEQGYKKRKKHKEKRPPRKITEKYLHNAGLAYLQRFTASTAHFRTIMMRKIDRSCRHHTDQSREDCATMLDKTVKKFKALGLLDDDGYTRGMVISLRRRGISARSILYKLQQKGLDQDLIQTTLNEIDAENEQETGENTAELIAALRLTRRKKTGPFLNKDMTDEKQMAQLARAGFSFDMVRKVLKMSKEEAENLLNRIN